MLAVYVARYVAEKDDFIGGNWTKQMKFLCYGLDEASDLADQYTENDFVYDVYRLDEDESPEWLKEADALLDALREMGNYNREFVNRYSDDIWSTIMEMFDYWCSKN